MARLRILGGKARGRTLAVPDSARPSPVRLRKALFDYLRSRFPRRGRFLDLYAGSGAVGLEAASEGYEAVLVESDPKAVRTLRENAHKLGLTVRVVPASAERFLEQAARRGERFDVVFLDPPYDQDLAAALARVLESGVVRPGGVAVLQHPSDLVLPLGERRSYGTSALTYVEVT
ncbi:MAG TPA: methyltransferase domain-containing protein [Oceanithermus profundus]|uniref:Methyltransferase domain-containing protein n=1 Tax=Oceanithermus profundus TaxID=187137 RepID=A0A7C4ZFP6_9DEIN|nr:methyltransferase domain-containing protein [Oceanithermus profundus]